MKKSGGFTLIEMMVVVGIISVLLSITVPNLLRNKVQANEAAAIEDLRVIGAAQVSYNASHNSFGQFADLADTSSGPGTGFLDEGWTDGREKNGYRYSMATADATTFVCFAEPVSPGVTGTRYFRVDASGIIRHDEGGQPDESGSPIGSS